MHLRPVKIRGTWLLLLRKLDTLNSRYLEVVGTIFYKFELPEVQINLHFG